jgi:hypothetical protein
MVKQQSSSSKPNPGKKCDICHGSVGRVFIDGGTVMGPWACMCTRCHILYGRGLGIGRGQKYEWNGKDFTQVEGGTQKGLAYIG